MTREEFYQSKAWKQVRKNIWLDQNCLCARCHRPVYVKGIGEYIPPEKRLKGIVHHKTYLTDENFIDPMISLDENNLEGLCIDCHNEEHFTVLATRSDVKFDRDGNLIPR